jgi:hypothetical protein
MNFAAFLVNAANRQQAPSPPTGAMEALAPTPGGIPHSWTHMRPEVLTPAFIEQQVESIYRCDHQMLANALHSFNQHLLDHGNGQGTGPVTLLGLVDGQLHLAYGIYKLDPTLQQSLPGRGPYKSLSHVMHFGARYGPDSLPKMAPVSPDIIFQKREAPLANFNTASQADLATLANPDQPIPSAAGTPDTVFWPWVPVLGAQQCEEVFTGLYGLTENDAGTWKLAELPV